MSDIAWPDTPRKADPQVYNKARHGLVEGARYVGRGSKYGSPFRIGIHGDRARCLALYEAYARGAFTAEEVLDDLKGYDLLCHCKPLPCHADFLLRWANPLR